ncbi:MAG: Na/Pi cotransporter family protein [Opitutales bacterium]
MNTFFQILGSLGLFLFGMKLMSASLQKLSGDKLRAIMHSMTGNRVSGILSGFGVTTIIQSSSATTVMVVSFVNAKLLTLRESIGVIMGANLGTTATAWIIAYAGYKFSLANIAIPLIGVGIVFSFFKKDGIKNWGEFAIGFGLLFLGLDYLKNAVPDVKSHPEFFEFVQNLTSYGYGSIFIFIIIGALITLVVQSSSVAMAITMAMATKGWIDFEYAAAIVLGENIGTTVTAIIASVQSNLIAKRAAFAHLTFNLIGVAWMIFAFYGFIWIISNIFPMPTELNLEMLTDLLGEADASAINIASLSPEALALYKSSYILPERLSMFHTLFNLTNILLLVGFVPQIENFVCKMVSGKDKKRRALSYPKSKTNNIGELTLYEGQRELGRLAGVSAKMFNGFVEVFENSNTDLTEKVKSLRNMEKKSDAISSNLLEFFLKCSADRIGNNTMDLVSRNINIAFSLEDICDGCNKLVGYAIRRYENHSEDNILNSDVFQSFATELRAFFLFAKDTLGNVDSMVSKNTEEVCAQMHQKMAELRNQTRSVSIAKLQNSEETREASILFIEILTQFERISSHVMTVLENINSDKVKID